MLFILFFLIVNWQLCSRLTLSYEHFRDSDELKAVLDSATYKSIKLRGHTPTMSYVNPLIDGFIEAMKTRFELNESETTVMNATKILHLKNWPKIESESDLKG